MEEGLLEPAAAPEPDVLLAPEHHESTDSDESNESNEFLDEEDLRVLRELRELDRLARNKAAARANLHFVNKITEPEVLSGAPTCSTPG